MSTGLHHSDVKPISAAMNSYESQFRGIVGENYDPSQDLGAEQKRELSALIFSMPDVQITRDGIFIDYEGWNPDHVDLNKEIEELVDRVA